MKTTKQRAATARLFIWNDKYANRDESFPRAFDDCFENGDGTAVVAILVNEAKENPALAHRMNKCGLGNWLSPGYLDDFQLANDPPPHKPMRFDDAEPMRQRPLIDGLQCLPGQLDLFD